MDSPPSPRDGSPQRAAMLVDKQYYPSAQEVYGPLVETLVEEEDRQRLEEPVIAPPAAEKLGFMLSEAPTTTYSLDYLSAVSETPAFVRNVALIGALHHGKTALTDLLVKETHPGLLATRFLDAHPLERARGVSVKTHPMTLLLETTRGKHVCTHLLDTPGHCDFGDEVAAALRLADGAVVVVDAVEGVTAGTERVLRQAAREGVAVSVVVAKIDRLILELRLPPADCYYKLRHTVESVNEVLAADGGARVSPELGNVVFAAAELGLVFSLETFAAAYAARTARLDAAALATRLWGDVWFDAYSRRFSRQGGSGLPRSFVHFVLEPLYKLVGAAMGEEGAALAAVLEQAGVPLKAREREELDELDRRPLLRRILGRVFGSPTAFADLVWAHVCDPAAGAALKAARTYSGPQDDDVAAAIRACDADGPLVVQIAKVYCLHSPQTFQAFGRVLSGRTTPGTAVCVLDEAYAGADDDEHAAEAVVSQAAFLCGRYTLEVKAGAFAGNLVLLDGVDATINKTATLVAAGSEPEGALRPLPLDTAGAAVLKVAVEPQTPGDLPRMVAGLQAVARTCPSVVTRVEESGEHTVAGPGELCLDCVLYELRTVFADIEVKVSDPLAPFRETVVDRSSAKSVAETPNAQNRVAVVAEPLDRGLAEAIERGVAPAPGQPLAEFLEREYDWDPLAARAVWTFGPDVRGPNALLNDTLPSETDAALLEQAASSLIQGFQWATREGPLCDEPMRGVKVRLLEASLATSAAQRGAGQLIPAARRACYAAFLLAQPRLMEPVYLCEVFAPSDCVAVVSGLVSRRRGHIVRDAPLAGTPLVRVHAYVPVLDACGLETDVRVRTRGQAFLMAAFDHWQLVPGDPLDRTLPPIAPLQSAPPPALARDVMLKTRRRKGLGDEVVVSKFFDDAMLLELAKVESSVLFS